LKRRFKVDRSGNRACVAAWRPYSTTNEGEVWALQRTKKPAGLRLSVLTINLYYNYYHRNTNSKFIYIYFFVILFKQHEIICCYGKFASLNILPYFLYRSLFSICLLIMCIKIMQYDWFMNFFMNFCSVRIKIY